MGECSVLDLPGLESNDGQTVFTRTFRIGPSKKALELLVCDIGRDFDNKMAFDGAYPSGDENIATLGEIAAGLVNAPKGVEWKFIRGERLVLKLPPRTQPAVFKLVMGRLNSSELSTFLNGSVEDPQTFTHGGPARYPETVVTSGVLGRAGGPYEVDTLTLPDDNPWKAWMRPGGLDFFADGKRAAISTWSGDVWIVSGIDDKLEKLIWKRFATGLFQPLGLKIVDDKIYALGRDQITRFQDLNGDGEADFYENFNNDVTVTPNFHEFALDLHTDPQGNFYFTKGGPLLGTQYWDPISAHNGCVLKVSKDGKKLEVFATGLRAPNGSGVGPRGEMTCSDNEGIWTPVCHLNWVKQGGFYGAMGMDHQAKPPTTYDPPLCWLPYPVDNSSGGQVWVTSKKWGPFEGELLHTSYGKCSLFHVLKEEVDGQMQGGVVKFPLSFQSGIMRGRFNSCDGQLYLVGFKGWQTTAARDGALQRVRYTGQPVHTVQSLHVTKTGIDLRFTTPLEASAATDLENYSIRQWNYRWSKEYGSDLYSVADPDKVVGKKGSLTGDIVEIKSAQLSKDGKTVSLVIPGVRPVMQMMIKFNLQAADGAAIPLEIFNTINRVP